MWPCARVVGALLKQRRGLRQFAFANEPRRLHHRRQPFLLHLVSFSFEKLK